MCALPVRSVSLSTLAETMASEKKFNTKATGVIALAVMLSRLLGLLREVVFNALFGTSAMGIFLIAFRAPNLLRDLFAEGALSISFVTVFSKKIESEGTHSAWLLAEKMLTLTTLLMSAFSLLGIFFANKIISVLAPGLLPQDIHMTVLLTEIMYPFILLVSLAALVMGILNSKNIFGVPALASSFFNIGSIIGGVFFGWLIDPHFGEKSLIGLAIGTLIGGIFQLAIQLPKLHRVGFQFRPNFAWRDAGIKNIIILTIPAIIAASVVQINVLVNTCFASYIGKEAITWLNSAFRLMQFPIGMFGVAVATVTLPLISRIAVTKNNIEFSAVLDRAMQLAIFLTLPAAVGLWFLAQPIIALIYQHGKFLATDTLQTAYVLQFYALGLVAYSLIKVLSPGFYAIDRKWVPMFVSFISIFLNIGLNYYFIFNLHMEQKGLALATSLSAITNFLTLYFLLNHTHALHTRHLLNYLLRCTLAAIALGFVCMFSMHFFSGFIYHSLFWIRCVSLLLTIMAAGLTYLFVCWMLRVPMLNHFLLMLLQKIGFFKKTANIEGTKT